MGMPPDEYWNGDAMACVAYRKAAEEQRKKADLASWQNGLYVYHALCNAAPLFCLKPQEPTPYPEKPFSFDKSVLTADEEAQVQKAADMFSAYAINFNMKRHKDEHND